MNRGRARIVRGGIRLAAGAVVAFALVFQIVDLSIHDALKPAEYFSYFTIQTNMANAVALIAGGLWALRRPVDTTRLATVAAVLVPYAIVTGVVYNLLLRGIPEPGYRGPQWPNEVMHVWIPIVIVLDWVLTSDRPRLAWRTIGIVAIYPIAWLIFTLIRGGITGWYPYPFLEPDGPNGVGGVVAYIVVLTSFILGMGALVIWRTRGRRRASVDATPTASGSAPRS